MVEEEVTDTDDIESTIKIPTYVTEILVDSDKTTLAKKDVDEINYMDIDEEITGQRYVPEMKGDLHCYFCFHIDGQCGYSKVFYKRCNSNYHDRTFRNRVQFRMSTYRFDLDFARFFGSPQFDETQYCIKIKYEFAETTENNSALKLIEFKDCAGESAVNKYLEFKSEQIKANYTFEYCSENLCNSNKRLLDCHDIILYLLASWIVIF
ncbi:uncharacterized protein LOC126264300 [Aethina tumida]|uniref:uncharacterized protein LOC126264300 n=1 Tax=Aethina tumida TaxID=116153 RepID=UPI002147AA7D|nr:uncharacterized protein LOC126264300 [Aethina tumida]